MIITSNKHDSVLFLRVSVCVCGWVGVYQREYTCVAFENNANNRSPLFRLACVAKILACVSILTKGRTKG